MKRSIKQTGKSKISSADKANTRPFTTKKTGYKEAVFNKEQQGEYQKSKMAKDNRSNNSYAR
jgi:hypothetical protein